MEIEEKKLAEQIKSLIDRIQPEPSPRFHQRMQDQPWFQSKPHSTGLSSSHRLILSAALISIFVFFFSLLTPSLEVVAQRLIQFFHPFTSDRITVQVPLEEISDPQHRFTLSIPEAETRAGFEFIEPMNLPGGYTLQGAVFHSERNAIEVNYLSDIDGYFLLISQRPSGEDYQKIGAEAVVEEVQIGNIRAEYVTGAWTIPEVESAITEESNISTPTLEVSWNPDAGVQVLRWQKGVILFEIIFAGNNPESPGFLTKPDLIEIAESMQ